MRKLIFIILLLPFVAFGQTTYQLNYDSIRVGKTTGTGATSLYGKTYLKNATDGTASDSILTVRNGRIYKIAGSAISSVGFMNYIFSRDASDISGYEQMPALTSYVVGAADTATVAATTAETLIQEFATNSGFPNTTLIPAGKFTVHYETQKAAGSNNYYSYAKIYKRALNGTETLLATTDNSSTVSVNTLQQVTVSALLLADETLLTTDRIVTKVYVRMSASTASINLYYDNGTDARLEFPSALVDATNFVPYNGATKDLVSAFSITGDSIKRVGGTGAQFLMGNGTVQDTTTIQTVANFFPKGDTRYARAFAMYKTAYVDTLGNNATAIIGRPDKPFATITAAIDALGSSGIVQIGVGRFASPDSSKIKSNFWFKGSGKPVPNWTINVNRTKTAPTRLINGTVLYGTFDASREKNITVSDLGIDVGSSWATTFNAGVAKDALLFAATDFMVSKPPLPGIVVQNVSTLGKDATSSFHAALFENLYYPIVNNLSTYYLAAGIVIKTTGGTYTDLQAFGHTTAGLYIKANNAIVCRDLVISNVTVSDINNYDNGGILFTAEANIFNVQLTNFSVRNVTGVGLRLFNNGAVIDNALISNGSIDSVKYAGGSTLGHGILGTFNYSNLSNIVIRDVDGSAFNMTGILNSSLSNLTASISGGYNFILSADNSAPTKVSDIYSYTVSPSNLGISWSGNGIYATNVLNTGTTSGTPLTLINSATSVITDNTTSNTTVYPTWSTSASYNSPFSVSTTKLSFNPSTGLLSSTGFSGSTADISGAFNAGNASSIRSTLGTVDFGFSGAGYPAFGYNVDYTSTLNSYKYKVGDISWMLDFGNSNSFRLRYGASGSAGSTISYSDYFTMSNSGSAKFSSLSGTGTRMVVADNTGIISTQAIPGGGGGSVTGVAIASSNGFAGTSDGNAVVPTLTLTTSVNSPVLAGNGTAISAATTTGSGSTVVLATSPTLVTPVLGAATATSLIASNAILVKKDGSNTATSGPFFGYENAAGNRQYIYQLDASNGIRSFHYNGSTYSQTSLLDASGNFNATGNITASNLSGTNTGDQTTITGNAGTATALQTARTIAGVPFDGTTNISLNNNAITNGAGYITSSALSTYAPLASPALTGNPTAPTQTASDNSTKIATTAYVDGAISTVTSGGSGSSKQIYVDYVDVGSSTTGIVNLNQHSVTTSTNGDKITFEYAGTCPNNGNTKDLTLIIDGNNYDIPIVTAGVALSWVIRGSIIRTSNTAFKVFVDYAQNGQQNYIQVASGVTLDTSSLAITLEAATAIANNDIVLSTASIQRFNAP